MQPTPLPVTEEPSVIVPWSSKIEPFKHPYGVINVVGKISAWYR